MKDKTKVYLIVITGTIFWAFIISLFVSANTGQPTYSINTGTLLDWLLKVLPLVTLICGGFAWYNTAQHKKYAAQQEFDELREHIRAVRNEQKEVLRLVKEHEQRTFEKYTQITNEIFRRFDNLQQDNNVEKQLLNNIWLFLVPNTSSGFGRRKEEDQ